MSEKFVVYTFDIKPEFTDQITTLQIMDVFDSEKEAKEYIDMFETHPLKKIEYQKALYR